MDTIPNTHVTSTPDRSSERIRSALYLDFDNVFSGLFKVDARTAMRLATSPATLLDALAAPECEGVGRDLLVRKAYLNPNGSIESAEHGNARGVIRLSRFRADLVRAGFEVIDCPSLCSSQKNAADIRMVLDVADAAATDRYDEFIIASSDSDFTPLLQRLRALDLRTVIVSANRTSDAYRNAAHMVIGRKQLTELISPDAGTGASTPPEPVVAPEATAVALPVPDTAEWVEPVPPTIASLQDDGALPKIPSDRWPVLFDALRAQCQEDGFTRNAAAGHVRDRLAAAGLPIGRATIERVVKGLTFGGARLGPEPIPTMDECADAMVVSVAGLLERQGRVLSVPETAELRRWLTGAGDAASPSHPDPSEAAA